MLGRLAIFQMRKDLGRKLTTEDLLGAFREKISLRCHVLSYWEAHLAKQWVKEPEEIPVLAITEMLDLTFKDQQKGIKKSTDARTNRSAFKHLWEIFRRDIDSVLTRKELLRKFPDLLTIESDYQEETLSDDQKKALRIFNRLEHGQVSDSTFERDAHYVHRYAPDPDIRKAVRIMFNDRGVKF